MEAFDRGRALVEESLRMHAEAEPEDEVMRAKVEDSLAECYLAVKDYDNAKLHYDTAYDLLDRTVGRNSPLFGKQARHSANLEIDRGRHADALPYLGEALLVETTKDAVKVHEVTEIVDLIVNTQQKCGIEAMEGVASNHRALKALRKNLRARSLDTSHHYGVLCHKMSLIYMHEHHQDPRSLKRAMKLAKKSVELLRANQGQPGVGDWLQMGEMHLNMLASVYKGDRR